MAGYVRVRRGWLSTRTEVWADPGSGRRVRVIAVAPVGEPVYYTEVTALVAMWERDGAVVLAEGSPAGSRLSDEDEAMAPVERAVMAQARDLAAWTRQWWARIGWVRRDDAWTWAETWQRCDLTALDLVRIESADRVARQLGHGGWVSGRDVHDPGDVAWFRAAVAVGVRAEARSANRPAKPGSVEATFVERRTSVALEGFDDTDPNRDVVMLWGPALVPGLSAGLIARGYRPTGDGDWIVTGLLPRVVASVADGIGWSFVPKRWRPTLPAPSPYRPVAPDPAVPLAARR